MRSLLLVPRSSCLIASSINPNFSLRSFEAWARYTYNILSLPKFEGARAHGPDLGPWARLLMVRAYRTLCRAARENILFARGPVTARAYTNPAAAEWGRYLTSVRSN